MHETRRTAQPSDGPLALLVATKKGAFVLRADAARREFALEGPHFLGHIVNHLVLDPRDRRTLLCAARTGHLGPTIFRSSDLGGSWKEASKPPAFPAGDQAGRTVKHTFRLEPASAAEPGVWYAGVSPQALFRSEDAGDTWSSVASFNDHPRWLEWTGKGQDGTPDGSILHSINVDPRDSRHLYVGLSSGGVFECVSEGRDWRPLNAGLVADFNPDPYPEFGQDPHCMRLHPLAPDVLWQQSHCGIYRIERPGEKWERVGDHMPRDVGDIGFPITLHPRDPRTAWVFPMDGTQVWPRTSPGGRPSVYVTRDAGASWQRQDAGLPRENAWLTVLRQSMTADAHDPVGLYFGTTCGELWASLDEGASWRRLRSHLPHVYAVEVAELDA
ncbi:MAG TPA: glycosyl hydrolase [Myxococcota bacterium]|nr:glycosyl hydrolase [Myxococcota bacterium]